MIDFSRNIRKKNNNQYWKYFCMAYINTIFVTDAGSQCNHSSRQEGQTAAVTIILCHLTTQDARNKCPTQTWGANQCQNSHLFFSFFCGNIGLWGSSHLLIKLFEEIIHSNLLILNLNKSSISYFCRTRKKIFWKMFELFLFSRVQNNWLTLYGQKHSSEKESHKGLKWHERIIYF